jgi:transcriptional regulator with XRE-family HTH domain
MSSLKMNEAPTTTEKDISADNLPLSVLLFYTAMRQQVALSEFAENVGIGPLSLRQFISGKAQRPRGRTLELLASALDMPVEEVRRRTALRPVSAPAFSKWLKEKMSQGRFSRAKLTRETRISDGALRNYISGQTLPDTDQAQRLATTLNVEPLEIAQVLVADHVERNGGETITSPDDMNGRGLHSSFAESDGVHRNTSSSPTTTTSASEEEHVLTLWRKLHPQGRRATLIYIAGLLAEE